MKRKLLALLLASVMVCALIACDKKEPENGNDDDGMSSSSIEISSSSLDESSSKDESSSTEESSSNEESSSTNEEGGYTEMDPEELKAEVEALLETKHKLTFNDDGSFRVLILADTHMTYNADGTKVKAVKDRIKKLVDEQQPNLVIFTGDNVIGAGSGSQLRASLNVLVSYIEEKQIPWCHVYGNHDHEAGYDKILQQSIYESYEYCISKEGPDLSGVGNYVHAIYNKDGSIGGAIYCIDSGTYAPAGGYDYIKDDQIQWYKDVSTMLQQYNGGKVVPSMMAFHIPLTENHDAYKNRFNKDIVTETDGERNENICSSNTDTNLFETILERGDVKAIVTGHDHVNDYMYNYKGVILSSSPNFSDLTYTDASVQGARVFDITSKDGETTFNTFVRYIVERLNPDDFENFETNSSFEITSDTIKDAPKSGWNNAALIGNLELEVSENGGENNSPAIRISRDSLDNFEFSFKFAETGKLGDNKYLVVWADFTVEFRKACFGLLSVAGHSSPYRTDDADYVSSLYYLADGSSEWQELKHGGDGCFGVGDYGSQAMKGKKGYFAIPVENLCLGSKAMTSDTLITGFYFYGSLNSGADYNTSFYLDEIYLVESLDFIKNK